MEICFVIYPNTFIFTTNKKLKIAPRKDEQVFLDDKLYIVTSVIHNIDESKIKIMLYPSKHL